MPEKLQYGPQGQQPPQNEADGAAQQLRAIASQLNDVLNLLRAQRDMLRKRGVNLPSGAMDNLRVLKQRLEALTKAVVDNQMELRSLRELAKTTALINSSQKTGEVLNQVMDTVIQLTGAERGYIVLKNRNTGDLEFRVARGMEQSTLDNSQGMIISKTVVNKVADSGEAVLTDNASQDERYQEQESIVGFALRSILAVPLKVQDEVIGVVYCDNRFVAGLFQQHELEVLTAFANQAAVAIQNARLFEAVRTNIMEVTELRDRMRNLFNSIASGVIAVDGQDQVLVSNDAAEQITASPQMEGRALSDVMQAIAAEIQRLVSTVREQQEQSRAFDFTPTIDNQPRDWTLKASPLAGNGSSQGVVMVIDDVTEQKKQQSQIVEALRYLPRELADVNMADVPIEERTITAMFADVRGFTSFSEKLEPGEVMRIINLYLSHASDAIILYEGIVEKYMGDAVTALFNTQLNEQADHVERAIQTAFHLQKDVQDSVLKTQDEHLFYGIGIHTGPALLGNIGGQRRREFMAVGEAPDICKYLQEQAGGGEIVVSAETLELVKDLYLYAPLTEIKRPKEGYEHIQCYRIIQRRPEAPPYSPFKIDLDDLDLDI